ncbi:MAG: response regulator [Candidatus Cloacimonetes bacterium]|nr:response regulator [Candidatus Cloacimonadota bacterium]
MSKILIIDDDIEIVGVLENIIEQSIPNSTIYSSLDGLVGMQMIRKHEPDLIILDINLPSVSGHTVCRTLKSDPLLKNIPILIITGESSNLNAKVKSLEQGAEAFLKKPFDIPEFIAQVQSLLRLKEAEDIIRKERDLLKIDVKLKEKELEQHFQHIELLFRAFIEVMATSIDALSIYNYESTQRVAEMVKNFLVFISKDSPDKYHQLSQDNERQENLIMAAWLHDIGKITVPLRLMNKFTRLGDRFPEVIQKLDAVYYYLKSIDADSALISKCIKASELVKRLNDPQNKVKESDIKLLKEYANLSYVDPADEKKQWLTDQEVESLSIKQGTLTESERKEIENHVRLTDLLLSKIPFSPDKLEIRKWCNDHHELLDGSGYYQGLKGDEISTETRILTIIDIFEALISNERPYKKHRTIEEALMELEKMASNGKLDSELVMLFKKSKAWEITDE